MTTQTNVSRVLPGWLICLLLLTFVIGTDDFVIAGVLRAIAQDLDVPESAAGQLITVFSITYAVTAPFMAMATAHLPRKTVLVVGMVVFAAINVGAALSDSYAMLMVFRVLAAVCASAMTPAAFATAGSLAPAERVGRYIGVVATGLTVALVVGVPVGTWFGAVFDWQATMVFVVVLSLLTAAGLAGLMPTIGNSDTGGAALRERLVPLATAPLLLSLIAMAVAAAGGLMAFVYVGPIAHSLGNVDSQGLAVLIAVIGVAGVAGALSGGKIADKWGAERGLLAALAVQTSATLVLAVLGLLWGGVVSVVLIAVLLGVWQIAGWALNSPAQTRLLKVAGPAANEAIALNTSALYVGIAASGLIGGAVLSRWGAIGVLVASSGLGLLGIVLFVMSFRVGQGSRNAYR